MVYSEVGGVKKMMIVVSVVMIVVEGYEGRVVDLDKGLFVIVFVEFCCVVFIDFDF